jgi:hypothetical protein
VPLFFFPHDTWTVNIFVPTLLGQYIIKNLVLLSAGVVIGATVQGACLMEKNEPIETTDNMIC